ncbi:MAG: hypothetical protein ACK4UO_15650 [Pseudolabrys sp.]
MKDAARRRTTAPVRHAPSARPTADDPHDAINQELLSLWIGISRLRDVLCFRERRRPACVARTRAKISTARKPRRKAA